MKNVSTKGYKPKNRIRIITATSLFDGHDVSINIIRRMLQNSGVEVIHLGHNRCVKEIVNCAIQEDVQAIAISSYQGGHIEYFKYMYDLLKENNATHIKIFVGGGGTILPTEADELHIYGITKLYSSDDGRRLGLQGIINDILELSDFSILFGKLPDVFDKLANNDSKVIGNMISIAENSSAQFKGIYGSRLNKLINPKIPVIGITGTGGSGKSTLLDELVRRYLTDFPNKTIAIVSVDPTKSKTGGALLGDRIRMNSVQNERVFMRSMATRRINSSLNEVIDDVIKILQASAFDCILLETSGIGQSGSEIVGYSDVLLYVMTPEYGSASQLEKIEILDYADLVCVNKFDKAGSLDALRDVKKQLRRNQYFEDIHDEDIQVYGTIASQFNDYGTDLLYRALISVIKHKINVKWKSGFKVASSRSQLGFIIPSNKVHYLEDIAVANRSYDQYVEDQAKVAGKLFQLQGTIELLKEKIDHKTSEMPLLSDSTKVDSPDLLSSEHIPFEERNISRTSVIGRESDLLADLQLVYQELESNLDAKSKNIIEEWGKIKIRYQAESLTYKLGDRIFNAPLYSTSLSNLKIPKISLPKYENWGDILKWVLKENIPGEFPFTAGVFPLKRSDESPMRMTAGEGGPERSNKRFHYLCKEQTGKRISTAHDCVTLYGEDPDFRPDIYGRIGNTGVSVCNLDDAKKLYSGFDLIDPNTSVNLTINGPAPIILGFFLNAAIDQQCEIFIRENGMLEDVEKRIESYFASKNLQRPCYNGMLPNGNNGLGLLLLGITGDQILDRDIYENIKAKTLRSVRGTVQADILKEDQAQNTCIFSTDFAMKLIGDVQEYFIERKVNNFYSISVSGYHMAEAGANPITQLAFSLANAFTYVEYFLSRGMSIDDFAPNMSFFFSNGMDPEYAVLGRVARRIWAKTIKLKYKGNERSQKLKYHVQTSGRSLQAQELDYNDIRTTLQALYAFSDNCNSLHTNAKDEAISLPTEKSVRGALAVQLIIDKELGLARNENPLQGSYIIEELTELVEDAVLKEFKEISVRGGVLGAMERMYQRSKIQEESMHYEALKDMGTLAIIGVNTFLNENESRVIVPPEVTRSTKEERNFAIHSNRLFKKRNEGISVEALVSLNETLLKNGNIFNQLMEACKVCTLGQITQSLYRIGGQYRRNT